MPRPRVAEDTAILRVELCGICGTDLKYFDGKLAAPYPLVLGHEVVGRVEEVGELAAAHHGMSVGDRVLVESSIPCWTCDACRSGAYRLCPTKGGYGTRLSTAVEPGLWGGMAELMYLAPGSIIHRLADRIAPPVAIAVPLLANGYQWLVVKGGLRPGHRVLIQGCGPQGLAAAMVAGKAGAVEVTMTGLAEDEARLRFARRTGARTVVVNGAHDRAAPDTIGDGYDLALDVSGSPEAVASAVDHLRPQGTLVLAGLVGRGVPVPIETDRLVWKEIRLQAVLSKDEAAIRTARALLESDPALAALAGELVSHTFPLEAAAEAITASRSGIPDFVKAAIAPSGVPARARA